ncbi:MAG: aminomethyltransferase [Candidatus Binatota bacterium]|nr:aminomethyltransferase [Candidatus Binatota bacterium]
MVEFAGWEMPVQYSGILGEHRAVRTAAGLFDVSHMGEVELRGAGAIEACQRLATNDVSRLADGDAVYTVLCLPSGGIVDDVIVTRLAADRLLVCVNASNRGKDVAWLREHRRGADVVDRSDELALIALQGPRSADVLRPLAELEVDRLRRFRAREGSVAGIPVLVSRTGYTGEDGFELYVGWHRAEGLWDALLEAGAPCGLVPAGLGARDTLRLEKGYALYGNDIDETKTPLEAGLGWVVKLDKGDFVGRDALLRQKRDGLSRSLVGLTMEGAGIPRHGYPILDDGITVGEVTSGTMSPMLGRGIALGYVPAASGGPGTRLAVEIRGRSQAVRVVRPPFFPPQ